MFFLFVKKYNILIMFFYYSLEDFFKQSRHIGMPKKLYFILQGAQIGLNSCLILDFIVTAEQLKNLETGGRSYSNL